MSTAIKWEPACLTFPIALSKPSVQQLRASNPSASDAFTFKVKTTNPRRYSVRPNVGVVWPGQESKVTVQLPALKEMPTDMNKCKDKFQVLTLALSAEKAEELKAMPTDAQRVALTNLWASDEAKDATVDKIRCAFALDSSYRDVAIPEEEHPITPYSPETVPGKAGAPPAAEPKTPAAHTPMAEADDEKNAAGDESPGGIDDSHAEAGATTAPSTPSGHGGAAATTGAKGSLETALEAAALREQVESLRSSLAQQQQRAALDVSNLEAELVKQRKVGCMLAKLPLSPRLAALPCPCRCPWS
jgi:hypothetical protein